VVFCYCYHLHLHFVCSIALLPLHFVHLFTRSPRHRTAYVVYIGHQQMFNNDLSILHCWLTPPRCPTQNGYVELPAKFSSHSHCPTNRIHSYVSVYISSIISSAINIYHVRLTREVSRLELSTVFIVLSYPSAAHIIHHIPHTIWPIFNSLEPSPLWWRLAIVMSRTSPWALMVVIGAMGSVDVAATLEPVGFVFLPFSGGPILMTWNLIGILACFCPCIVYGKVINTCGKN
jgi:hypothetical protein